MNGRGLTVHCSEAGCRSVCGLEIWSPHTPRQRPLFVSPLRERNGLSITALQRDGAMSVTDKVEDVKFWRTVIFWPQVGVPKNVANVGTRIEIILHTVLQCQIDRMCFHGGEAGTTFGEKVEQERIRKKEGNWEQKTKNKRTEHPS